jgi:hypothetical protein
MKKLLFIFTSILILSTTSHAQTCIGGQMITGNDTTRSFCLSNKTMNWWAAYQWCVANGRTLAHPDNLCNYDGEGWFFGSYGCPNLLKNSYWPNSMWTSLSTNNDLAVFYQFNNILTTAPRTYRVSAVCE